MATGDPTARGRKIAIDPDGPAESAAEEPAGEAPRQDAPTRGLPPEPTEVPASEIADIQRHRDALRDQLLRKAAEFDNYRKRVDRERRELSELAAHDLLLELLPILDNLERALGIDVPAGAEPYREGVELILKQFQDLLRKRGVTPIDSVGADFDPHVHQAIAHEVSTTHRDGEVMAELQRGYRLGERLLREAMVKVAKRE
jgi:molecular chaperone GrpE